jgi:NAD(P)H-hydrate epimerase
VTDPPVNAIKEATPMKVRPLSREEVRAIDARAINDFRLPTIVLMENAGRGAASWLRDRIGRGRVVVACGPGNNGGDGGVVARHLDAWGFDVRIAWFADPAGLKGDAATQRDILERSEIPAQVVDEDTPSDPIDALWAGADWLIDALLGTGLARPVGGLIARAIGSMNGSGRPILALDLPSGLDADSGQPLGDAIRATATATFVAPKLGFASDAARVYTGEVFVVDIGVPRALLTGFSM